VRPLGDVLMLVICAWTVAICEERLSSQYERQLCLVQGKCFII